MFSFEFNKLAGAFLGACVFAMALGIAAEGIYTGDKPAKAGYELPELKVETAAEKPAAAVPLPVLLAKADATKGQADTKVCQACHNFEKGAGAKVGPALYGVVERPKGSAAGFDYSAGLKGKGGNWSFEDLDQFLTNPKGYITGTKMGYAGEADAGKRADILAYLRSLSDSPVSLPAAPAASAEAKPETAGAPAAASTKAEDKASAPNPAAAKAAAPAGNMTPGAPAGAAERALPPAPAPAAATVPPASPAPPPASPVAAAAPAATPPPATPPTGASEAAAPPTGAAPQK